MFGRWLRQEKAKPDREDAGALGGAVRANLPGADDETVRVVTAISGLIGVVAYADRSFTEHEEGHLRNQLARVHGMTEPGIDAICAVLRRHIVEVATVQVPRYSRDLCELADRELRVEILQVLVDIAASDGEITHVETTVLRQLTTSLGLDQRDYNTAQAVHRDKLGALKSR
jgi:uncharacterized tellurite resistance protein B-like protein